jgi:RNA polymerase sigma-70 factor (ECF subfamily)
MQHLRCAPEIPGGSGVELYRFDENYVKRLRAADAVAERHFVSYFGELLRIKLHSRSLPHDLVEDITQETFARVLAALKRESALRSPECLGAFVNSVCNNVLLEHYRRSGRESSLEDAQEPVDTKIDLNRGLVSAEAQHLVREILDQMSDRDRMLLKAFFLEEKSKDQICRQLSVDRDYLRVLLHRAKIQFRERIWASSTTKME